MLEQLKKRLEDIEKAMVDAVNHNTVLQVRADEVKYLISLAEGVAQAVAPGSVVTEVLQAAEGIVDAVSQPESGEQPSS